MNERPADQELLWKYLFLDLHEVGSMKIFPSDLRLKRCNLKPRILYQ